MENQRLLSDSSTRRVLRKINISLSPDNHFSHRINLLPKLQEFKKRKNSLNSLQRRKKSSYKSQKIKLNHPTLNNSSKKADFSSFPHFFNSPSSLFLANQEVKPISFKTKPLTPASLRMHDFCEYKHRLTTGKSRSPAEIASPYLPHLLKPSHAVLRKFSLTAEILKINTRVNQCYSLGRYSDALDLASQAMAKAESLEAESAIRLTCKSNMALLFKTTGKYQEAISMFQELVEAYTRTLGHSHPSTLTVRHNLASTYKASGSPDLAASSLDPLPDLTPSTVQSYILAALCWKDLNDLPKANQIISKAEDFVNTTFGVGNSVNLLNAKGLIAKSSSDFILAEKCFLKALEIRKEWNGDSHPETIIVRHNLAELYLVKGEKEKSSQLMQENLKIMQDEIKSKGPFYTPEEALRLLREGIEKPPNEAFGLTVKLGVDPTKGEQNVRGNVFLPAGTGKKNKIAVFIPEEHKDLAYKLGATIAGSELMNNVKEGKIDFEQVLATEEMIDELKPFGRVLGQRGLMPTLRNKTVVPFSDFEQEMNKLTKGTVSYKITKAAIIHGTLGKASLTDAEVLANLRAFMTSIIEEKPNHFKKTYLKKVFMTSTFTKSYELDIQLVDINHYRCVLSNYKLS